jgi:hypothetical protein
VSTTADQVGRGRAPAQAPAAARRRGPSATAIAGCALALTLVFLLLFYGESRYRSCIQRVEAQYPAVPVSSFNQRSTGPLKVSFVDERARALRDCGRL